MSAKKHGISRERRRPVPCRKTRAIRDGERGSISERLSGSWVAKMPKVPPKNHVSGYFGHRQDVIDFVGSIAVNPYA